MINHAPAPTRTAALFVALVLAGSTTSAQSTEWQFIPTTSPYPQNIPQGSDAPANDEVWIVGNSFFFDPFPISFDFTFAMRFDGTQWNFVETPEIRGSSLYGVMKMPDGEVWVVGAYEPSGPSSQTLFLRYDGDSWTLDDSPTRRGGSIFQAIGRAGDDVWAVGGQTTLEPPPSATGQPLAARWEGDRWVRYEAEALGTGGRAINSFRAISGATEDDAWAVGQGEQTGTAGFPPTAFLNHWNGDRWELVDIGLRDFGFLGDVIALASDDVWAVGSRFHDDIGTQPLIIHFDGSAWAVVDTPVIPGGRAELRAIAARSPTEIYASGTDADADGTPRALILKYDGSAWTRMDVPTPPDGSDQWFRTMSVTPSGDVWAMGQYYRPDEQAIHVTTQRLGGSAPCRADLDGDGELTIFDFLEFQNRFDAGDPTADFDGDGELTIFDFLAFQNAFDAGCA
ncbi:MAG: GC-type dockerin domain-anchored protein [Phycisphaerales bacterium]|jgi:hypothetical protein